MERERVSILCGTVTEDEIPSLIAYMASEGRIVTLHHDKDGTIYWDAQHSPKASLINTANQVLDS